jgi:hypothetical protein
MLANDLLALSGVAPEPSAEARALRPGRLARLLARTLGGSLDRALAAGDDPLGSPRLAARAALLTDPRSRAASAEGIERLLDLAGRPSGRHGVLRTTAHVTANTGALRELAIALRSGGPVYARGIAIVNELLSDGVGPAFVGGGESLAGRLGDARAALAGREAPLTPAAGAEPPWRRDRECARAQPWERGPVRLARSHRFADGSWVHARRDSA